MFQLFYRESLENFKEELEKNIKFSFIANKKTFIDNILKSIIYYADNIVAPIICWQIYLDKSEDLLKGDNSFKRFNYFVKLRKNNLLSLYPEIEKLLFNFLQEEKNFILYTLENIQENHRKIINFFNLKNNSKIESIIYNRAVDRHYKGKKTIFLKFTDKKYLKVKPYIFSYQPLFNFILKKFNSDNNKNLTLPKSLKIKNFWIAEFVTVKNKNIDKNTAKKFYQNLGNLWGLVFALNGCDFHMENIIAQKWKPIILDTETFFTNYSAYKNKRLLNSLLPTGFIENNHKQPTSAILGGNKKLISLVQPIILYKNSDRIRIKFRTLSKIKPNNRIFKSNKKLWNPKIFKNDIIKGFKEAYLWIEKNRDYVLNLISASSTPIFSRVILRKTSFYSLLIQHVLQPLNFPLKNFEVKLKKTLRENSKRFHNNYYQKDFKKIIDYEIDNIKNLSIPIFWQNIKENNLYSEKFVYKNFFKKTAFDLLIEKFSQLTQTKLKYYIKKIEKYLK